MPRGYRPIVVGPHLLRWRFEPGVDDSVLTVIGPPGADSRLVVTLHGWRDPWHAITGFTVTDDQLQVHHDATNDPAVVASGFVRAAIDHALALGWDPQGRGVTFPLDHVAGAFQPAPA
ncbi:MAG: hypothetical protein IPL61_28155 [Myxococcales bacterium]|nr:hypothetical protein [Myxococcales bacterium]